MANDCAHCEGTGVQVYGSVCHGLGPTRVYEPVELLCWDCQGSGVAPEPAVFHGLDQASLDSIFKEKT